MTERAELRPQEQRPPLVATGEGVIFVLPGDPVPPCKEPCALCRERGRQVTPEE
ncbi:hypothetical protein SNOUR_28685 [Streptomyces noursei ATCC 11455]|nr:hypothetical protein SNOUR_28685 [Streptomyces noursei ATCC 11455]